MCSAWLRNGTSRNEQDENADVMRVQLNGTWCIPCPFSLFVGGEHQVVSDASILMRESTMLGMALTFFLLAIVAGLLGFFALAGLAALIAKVLLFVFLVLLIVSAFAGRWRRSPPV
jgi:uncharacterized membrane protein YtjA (UPF0391 family)